jgi:eukaryotic-like serine/threonine-protein kinase
MFVFIIPFSFSKNNSQKTASMPVLQNYLGRLISKNSTSTSKTSLPYIFKTLFTFSATLLMSVPVFSQSMFRGGADHQAAVKTPNKTLFGEEAWKFNANAPIRSSVAYSNDAVFFGSSFGELFALDQKTGRVKWRFQTTPAINSSPAFSNGKVYFSDNQQSLYALQATTGKLIWKSSFEKSLDYEWAFDYFYSSPTIFNNKIYIGSKDGNIYCINEADGKIAWKYKTTGMVRSTPAVKDGIVYVGSTEGILYALNAQDGKEVWKFLIAGNAMKNEDFGFDRRAIISSPVIAGDKILVGGRDGFLYAVNKLNGKEIWRVDHQVSWVISSVAVKDTIVVTGTSDGRFVQAVNLNTGKEIWKYRTRSIVWSSPLIVNDQVYIGSHESQLFCFDLYTGKKLGSFQTNGTIFTAPVLRDSILYFGCDDGFLYALKPSKYSYAAKTGIKKFVYWEPNSNFYFRNGTDVTIKEFLAARNYAVADAKKLVDWMSKQDSAVNSVIVFASNYFPVEITKGYDRSLLRQYLQRGGKVVLLGNNPIIFKYDSTSRQPIGFNVPLADSVLSIQYGPNDSRAFKGQQPAFPTEEGRQWGLRKSWTAALSIQPTMADIILGKDENGLASAWVKKYHSAKGAGLVQIFVNPDGDPNLVFIEHVAEYGLAEN